MPRAVFDSVLDDVSGELRVNPGPETKGIPLERSFDVAISQRDARRNKLASLVPGGLVSTQALDLLLIIDVVAAAAAFDLGQGRVLRPEENPSQVVDLWARATATRSLWYDVFVACLADNSTKKLNALTESVLLLGTESVAQGLHSGVQPAKFTGFISEIARSEVGAE
jgi:hypothetical protein